MMFSKTEQNRRKRKRERKKNFIQYFSANSYRSSRDRFETEQLIRQRRTVFTIITTIILTIAAYGVFKEFFP